MKRGLGLLAALPLLLAADGDVPELLLPVACKIGQSCVIQHYVDDDPSPGVRDYHCGARTYDKHDGIDFRLRSMVQQRMGVGVLAAADGTILRTRDGMADVSVRIAGKASVANRECGNAVVIRHRGGVQTQYCHLARGSILVKPGQAVKGGAQIANVGMSGAAEFPHLHFVVRLRQEVIDPFAFGAKPGQCNGGRTIWAPAAGLAHAYQAGEVLVAGFATRPMTFEAAQERGADQLPRPSRDAPRLVAFVQSIGLEGGDIQQLSLTAPDGSTLADNRAEPLNRNKAQTIFFVGRARPAAGWPTGRFEARYVVLRAGKPVIDRRFATILR